jgi:hypothetical protein
VYRWGKESKAEGAVATEAGSRALTLRSTAGPPTAMLFGPYVDLEADHEYRISVEYRLPGATAATLKIDETLLRGRDLRTLPPTGGDWATVDAVVRAGATVKGAKLELGYTGTNLLAIRGLEVADLGQAPPAAAVLYKSDFAATGPFTVRKGAGRPEALAGRAPTGLTFQPWDSSTDMEVAGVRDAGDAVVQVRNLSGKASAMILTPEMPVQPAARCWVRIEYKGDPHTVASVRVLCRPARARDIGQLVTTRGTWKTVYLPYELAAGEGGTARIEIHPAGVGADKGITLRSIEITQAPPAGDPAPAGVTARNYRLTLAGARPFARRYKGDAVIESQGDGTLPAGWVGKTANEATLGDVFIDTVGGAPAIGLRNQEGPPAVRLFTAKELVQATAGKRYRVKVTYQTEAEGRGWVAVAVGGSEVQKFDLTTSAGAWKESEVTVTAPAAGGLTLTVGGESVGSDASVYIKDVEVRELP